MALPCVCVKLGRRSGMVLTIVLTVIILSALLLAGIFCLARYELGRSKKQLEQDRAVAGMETAVTSLRSQIRDQFAYEASLDIPSLSSEQSNDAPGESNGLYSLSLRAQSAAGDKIVATQGRTQLVSLGDDDDPFRGASAIVDLLNVSSNATNEITRSKAEPASFGTALSLLAQPVMAIRQIPVSQFSLYSSTNLFLDGAVTPDAGRVYALNDIVVQDGHVGTDFPVAAGANVGIAAGGSLASRSDPDSQPVSMQVTATTDPNWAALSKSVDHSTILSGSDLPLGTMSAATIEELTAPPASPSAGWDKDCQRLYRQCSRILAENEGRISVTTSDGQLLPAESATFSLYRTRKYSAGPVIVFDYKKVAPNAQRNSYYIASSNLRAIVLVRNATTLGADLSIVSPHAICVAGGFNSGGPVRAASLITASRLVALPAGW